MLCWYENVCAWSPLPWLVVLINICVWFVSVFVRRKFDIVIIHSTHSYLCLYVTVCSLIQCKFIIISIAFVTMLCWVYLNLGSIVFRIRICFLVSWCNNIDDQSLVRLVSWDESNVTSSVKVIGAKPMWKRTSHWSRRWRWCLQWEITARFHWIFSNKNSSATHISVVFPLCYLEFTEFLLIQWFAFRWTLYTDNDMVWAGANVRKYKQLL